MKVSGSTTARGQSCSSVPRSLSPIIVRASSPPFSAGRHQRRKKRLIHDAAWFAKHHVDLRLDTVVTQFNLERKHAVLANGQAIEFKKACLATGSRARRPQVAGYNLGNIFYLRSQRDVLALREVLDLEKDIVIVGGGRIAAEVAALLSVRAKTHVTVIHRGRHMWSRWLDEETGAWLDGIYLAHGVKMLLGETLNGFEGRTILAMCRPRAVSDLPRKPQSSPWARK